MQYFLLVQTVAKAIDQSSNTIGLFIDFSKAYPILFIMMSFFTNFLTMELGENRWRGSIIILKGAPSLFRWMVISLKVNLSFAEFRNAVLLAHFLLLFI